MGNTTFNFYLERVQETKYQNDIEIYDESLKDVWEKIKKYKKNIVAASLIPFIGYVMTTSNIQKNTNDLSNNKSDISDEVIKEAKLLEQKADFFNLNDEIEQKHFKSINSIIKFSNENNDISSAYKDAVGVFLRKEKIGDTSMHVNLKYTYDEKRDVSFSALLRSIKNGDYKSQKSWNDYFLNYEKNSGKNFPRGL
jgi:hypothetical protein